MWEIFLKAKKKERCTGETCFLCVRYVCECNSFPTESEFNEANDDGDGYDDYLLKNTAKNGNVATLPLSYHVCIDYTYVNIYQDILLLFDIANSL